MNPVLPILLIAAAIVVPSAGVAGSAPTVTFTRPYCPYTVRFPAPPAQSEAPQQDGSKYAVADLVVGGTRLSVFCATSAQASSQNGTQDASERHAQIAGMANALGISGYVIRDIDALAPSCSEVEGALDSKGAKYHIVSRLCFDASSTFIAEAVFASDSDDAIGRSFVNTLSRGAEPADPPHAP